MAKVVFAGGGTAGHIEPALAVARQWKLEHPLDECIFLGTSSGLETTLVPAAGFTLNLIPKVSISRRPSPSWAKVPLELLAAIFSARKLLKNAELLIGFGGYVSGPAYIAAKISRVPIVIHEANAKPGWANRLGSLFTKNLAVAHPVKAGKFSRALITGLPLRADVAEAFRQASGDWATARRLAKSRLGFENQAPLVFVMGGSQGSISINKVIEHSVNLFKSLGINVLHSVGQNNQLPESSDCYKAVSYMRHMGDAYLAADLIISRSGAVTCSEFRTVGRYALFVPLPIGNGEQFLNAATLVDAGRAELIDQKELTVEFLQKSLLGLLEKASKAPIAGDEQDLQAAQKICALAQFAVSS